MRNWKRLFLFSILFVSPAFCQTNWWDAYENDPTAVTPNATTTDPYENFDGVCCECVPFYQCDENQVIIEDGAGILGPRVAVDKNAKVENNVEVCSDSTQLCCRVSTAPVDCQSRIADENRIRTCECVPWELCLDDNRVSDGTPPVTTLDNGVVLPNHARCPHSLEVCCHFEEFITNDTFVENNDRALPTPDSDGCACVNPWICDEQGFVLEGAFLPEELTKLYSTLEESCAPPFTCCKLRPADSVTTTSPVVTSPPVKIENQTCNGLRNAQGIRVRISGFTEGESQFGEFPWVGMILRTFFVAGQPMNNFLGGAILIHPQVMLTAAHKVNKESIDTLSIRVGEWDVQTEFEPQKHQIRDVERVIIHPAFNERSLSNDVALVILKEPVVIQSHIRSICMADSIEDVETRGCIINGWGEDSFASDNYQTVMKSVSLPMVPNKECQNMLRKTRLGRRFRLHPSFVCAGGEKGKDACRSDGGGPLACPRKGTTDEYLLVGITAWGIGCGEDGVPGVYASTIHSKSWISEEIAKVFPDSIHLLTKKTVIDAGDEVPLDAWRTDLV